MILSSGFSLSISLPKFLTASPLTDSPSLKTIHFPDSSHPVGRVYSCITELVLLSILTTQPFKFTIDFSLLQTCIKARNPSSVIFSSETAKGEVSLEIVFEGEGIVLIAPTLQNAITDTIKANPIIVDNHIAKFFI